MTCDKSENRKKKIVPLPGLKEKKFDVSIGTFTVWYNLLTPACYLSTLYLESFYHLTNHRAQKYALHVHNLLIVTLETSCRQSMDVKMSMLLWYYMHYKMLIDRIKIIKILYNFNLPQNLLFLKAKHKERGTFYVRPVLEIFTYVCCHPQYRKICCNFSL